MPAANFEVWGAPIDHSRSPDLHTAAYRALGLDWRFGRREVAADRFDAELAASRAHGLAVTYPIKERAYAAASWRDDRAELTGVANTLLRGEDVPLRGYNTDVGGIARALAEIGAADAESARIVGSGATATSALVALGELGIHRVEVAARRPERASELVALGERIGVRARATELACFGGSVDLTIATLPGGTDLDSDIAARLSEFGGTLFDVAYGDGPSALVRYWTGEAHHGLPMLLHQAVLQVRIFTSGSPETPLAEEPRVIDAMRNALG